MSIPAGLLMMTLVNIELILKNFLLIFNPKIELPKDPDITKSENN